MPPARKRTASAAYLSNDDVCDEVDKKIFETGIQETTVNFDWNVNSFDLIRQLDSLIAEQQIQTAVTDAVGVKTTWKLNLARVSGECEWIGLHITLLSSDGSPDKMTRNKCRVTVDGVPKLNGILEWLPKSYVACNHFISKDWRTPTDGILRIQVSMTMLAAITSGKRSSTEVVKSFNHNHNKRACVLLTSLAVDTLTSDTTIVSKDKKRFPVHRLILGKVSPVFERMFQTDMLERSSGIIRCEDLSGKCVQLLMNFIYTGRLPEKHEEWTQPDVLWELTYAAEKYQLDDLVNFLDESLGILVKPEGAPKLLNLANKLCLKKAQKDLHDAVIKLSTSSPEMLFEVVNAMSH